jgi:DNA-binding response OmpR family regulator
MSARPILVVDDDPKIVRLIRTYLERDGHAVVEASDGRSALAAVAIAEPELIVLDVMLPEIDGLSVLEAVRRTWRTPVLVVSALGTATDRIRGFERGADDYLPKPFSPAELAWRVRRLLERAHGRATELSGSRTLEHGALRLDPARQEAFVGASRVDLTRAEFRLLQALLEADGQVLTRDQLIDAVHGLDGMVLDRTIDVHVRRLRSKLGDDPDSPRFIATVRGIGYRAAPLAAAGPVHT